MTSQQLYNACIEHNEYISNWCSDLYIEVNDFTKELVKNYEFRVNVSIFKNNVTGKLCYEIPFAYPGKRLSLNKPF